MAQAKLELLLELKNRLKAGLSSAKNSVLNEMKDIKARLSSFTASNMKAFSAISEQVPFVGRAVSLLANPYALAAAAALSFAAAGAKATQMALDWEKSMAKVNVTAQLNHTELDKLSKRLLYVGAYGTTELQQVPEAFNVIISAIGDTNKSMELLPYVLKASKAGFTDLKIVADAATGVLASSGENATVVFDTLFATLNKGKAEFQDIAQYLPLVIPGAKNAGFQLRETAGAFAFLTANGIAAMQSATGLKNAFKALSNPETISKFKQIGIEVYRQDGSTRSLLEIITSLNHEMAGLTDKQRVERFSKLGLDMDSAMAFSLMSQKANELKNTIDFVVNGQGQFNEAIKNSKTSTEGWAMAWNKIKFLAIEFGQIFVPIFETVGTLFNDFMDLFIQGTIVLKGMIAGVWAVTKQIFSVLTPIGEAIANIYNPNAFARALKKVPDAIRNSDVKGTFLNAFSETIADYKGKANGDPITAEGALSNLAGGDFNSTDTTTTNSGPSGSQSKSIIINIEALHKGDNKLSVNGEGMTLTELERKMNEIFMRTIRNVEASY